MCVIMVKSQVARLSAIILFAALCGQLLAFAPRDTSSIDHSVKSRNSGSKSGRKAHRQLRANSGHGEHTDHVGSWGSSDDDGSGASDVSDLNKGSNSSNAKEAPDDKKGKDKKKKKKGKDEPVVLPGEEVQVCKAVDKDADDDQRASCAAFNGATLERCEELSDGKCRLDPPFQPFHAPGTCPMNSEGPRAGNCFCAKGYICFDYNTKKTLYAMSQEMRKPGAEEIIRTVADDEPMDPGCAKVDHNGVTMSKVSFSTDCQSCECHPDPNSSPALRAGPQAIAVAALVLQLVATLPRML